MPSLKSLKTKIPVKRAKEPPSVNLGDNLPEIALAAIVPSRRQKEIKRIVVGTSMKCILPAHLRDDSPPKPTPVKKIKPEKRKVRERVVA
ncbi:uncharacterized protein LOC133525798 isoform X2 [Cydia pomonella]|uniref:uncharacterized protein LOC133525798 isoform X2 n=1 Tax=Cydia pomonella TaxID=82600 RepID=UPI002ADDEEFB|nr:uncharacterized protein LOC133525798 isoform X2 [Cydia pomonella]